MKKILIYFVFCIVFFTACESIPPYAGPDAEIAYREVDIKTIDNVWKELEKDPSRYWAGFGYKLVNTQADTRSNSLRISAAAYGDFFEFDRKTLDEQMPLFFERLSYTNPEPSTYYISVHPRDPANPRADLFWRLDRVEGLISLEEYQAIVARNRTTIAERAAQEEAQRKAEEAANRYDASRFTVVPSDFRPANYAKKDLFAAIASVKDISSNREVYGPLIGMFYQINFASDVIFVSQNGTDIVFRTSDNAISQRMKINQRSGLTSGQRVRIYYEFTKPSRSTTEWIVHAIERL
jgi:hypothetical protein